MIRINTISILLAFLATLWFWKGIPETIDIPSPPKELPLELQLLNAVQPLNLQYKSGITSERIGSKQLTLIGGEFEKRFTVCSIPVKGRSNEISSTRFLYVGLDLGQLKSRDVDFNVKDTFIAAVKDPLLDQSNSQFDLPGFALKSYGDNNYTIFNIENSQLVLDSLVFEDDKTGFIKHSFISNNDFTVVITKNEHSPCEAEQFTFDIYRHSATTNKFVYFIDDITNENGALVKGVIESGDYAKSNETKFGIQSLVEQMKVCEQIKFQHDEWQYASRYHYNNQVVNDGFSPVQSEHCQKVLATFYHTPAGNVVRKRALKTTTYEKPMIAITGKNLVDVSVFHNDNPVAFEQGSLSLYQKLLFSNEDVNNKNIWHKIYQSKATFILPPTTSATNFYVLGDNIQVFGANVISTTDQCFESLCDKKSSVTKLRLAASNNPIRISATGINQSIPLLKQNLAQLDAKPSIQHTSAKIDHNSLDSDNPVESSNVTFSVVDRNNEKLTVTDIPHLLAPRGGRINASMGNTVQLTIDKMSQLAVQKVLENYMASADLNAKFATLSLVNAKGEILALAQTPQVDENINYEREGYKQSYRPFDSPLTFNAAYHDGSNHYVSGSVMKLLSALLIANELGVNHPFIKGISYNEWFKQRKKTQMNPKLWCYPTYKDSCIKDSIKNFRGVFSYSTISKYHKDLPYGLKEALRDSLNSYFAFMVSKVADEPLYHQQAFGDSSFKDSSKLRDFVSKFGFYSPLKLDAGLLGNHVRNTVFYAPESQLNYNKKIQLWRAAVGEGNIVTALQVAQFTLAIANEELIPLSLMKSLDGIEGQHKSKALPIKPEVFSLVQEGMKLAAKSYSSIKNLPDDVSLYAKSGTGEIGEKDKFGKSLNNVWMTAYLHPESPVVMTCQIVKVKGVSKLCAELINNLIAHADEIPALGLIQSPINTQGVKNAE